MPSSARGERVGNVDRSTRIVGLEVGTYKNVHDVWLPWHDGLALFGANGAGKTNILECLCLLVGNEQAVTLARPRLALPEPGALALVVEAACTELPWSPEEIFAVDPKVLTYDFPQNPMHAVWIRIRDERQWWDMVGAQSGTSFVEGLLSAGTPDRVAELVAEAAESPVIRYELRSVQMPEPGTGLSEAMTVRHFERVLCLPNPPEWLSLYDEELPDVFAPLRSAVAAHPTNAAPLPVLSLPTSRYIPVTLQWLARSRTADEINEELRLAWVEASGQAELLAEQLAALPLTSEPWDPDTHWWLHKIGELGAQSELDLTLPHVAIRSLGSSDADYELEDRRSQAVIGRTHSEDVVEHFSAGERRWVDEALATAARVITRFGLRAAWQAPLFDELDEDETMEALLAISDDVNRRLGSEGYWTEGSLDLVVQALEPQLVAAGHRFLANNSAPLALEFVTTAYPGIVDLQPTIVIRAIDEPEAHLHPTAQRHLARALERMRLRGDNVVIASHSPYFLDLDGWLLAHVQRDVDGSSVAVVDRSAVDASSALAAELGLSRGELLAGVAYVLIVEGQHDLLVLETLYGDELSSAGVALLRMHGTNNVMAAAELDFVERYLHVPIGVLTDYTNAERVKRGEWETDEERRLVELKRACKRRGRRIEIHGLRRPDIIAYLNENTIRSEFGTFPGWKHVLKDFSSLRQRPSFKSWLADKYKVDLTRPAAIKIVLAAMQQSASPPAGELTQFVDALTARAAEPLDNDDGG